MEGFDLFEDGHLRSSKLSKEELRSEIGDLDVSVPTLGSSSGDNQKSEEMCKMPEQLNMDQQVLGKKGIKQVGLVNLKKKFNFVLKKFCLKIFKLWK